MLLNCDVGEDSWESLGLQGDPTRGGNVIDNFLLSLLFIFLLYDFFKFKFIYFNWKLITLQYCIGVFLSTETCIISNKKWIASPGSIQDAWGWCTGMTWRDVTGREVGGEFRMGNTCTPVVDSCWCVTEPIQYCKVKKKKSWKVLHYSCLLLIRKWDRKKEREGRIKSTHLLLVGK